MIDLQDLLAVAVELRARNPLASARTVLDVVMHAPPGGRLKTHSVADVELGWLSPRGRFATLLREALAPEIEEEFSQLLDDPAAEVRQVFWELWEQTVLRRFCAGYFGWAESEVDELARRFRLQLAEMDLRRETATAAAAGVRKAA
ncbi:MAG TPA: hypothetical protein VLA16_08350 [Ideonella sp.]|nr:hypothetical protein [Ideonella sp.]